MVDAEIRPCCMILELTALVSTLADSKQSACQNHCNNAVACLSKPAAGASTSSEGGARGMS